MKAVCKIGMKWVDDLGEAEMSGRWRREEDAEQQQKMPF